VADLVDEHRTAITAGIRPAMRAGPEHEVIENELPTSLEEVEQLGLAVGALENVGPVDLDHRLAAAFCGQCVAGAGSHLFLGQQRLMGGLPRGGGYNFWEVLLSHVSSFFAAAEVDAMVS
jgi:hypothetical protein